MAPKVLNVTGNGNGVIAVGGYTTPSLTCSFEANPPPSTYGWMQVSTGAQIDPSAIILIETDPGWYTVTYDPDAIGLPWLDINASAYQCYATNALGQGLGSVAVSVPSK